jgi:hypothetical protein
MDGIFQTGGEGLFFAVSTVTGSQASVTLCRHCAQPLGPPSRQHTEPDRSSAGMKGLAQSTTESSSCRPLRSTLRGSLRLDGVPMMTGPQHVCRDRVAFRAAHAEVVLDRRLEIPGIAAGGDAFTVVSSAARVPGVALLCSP